LRCIANLQAIPDSLAYFATIAGYLGAIRVVHPVTDPGGTSLKVNIDILVAGIGEGYLMVCSCRYGKNCQGN
jgi:hypothetical protein